MAYNMFLSDNGIFSLRSELHPPHREEVIGMWREPLQRAAKMPRAPSRAADRRATTRRSTRMREWGPRASSPHHGARGHRAVLRTPDLFQGLPLFRLKLCETALGKDLRADVSPWRRQSARTPCAMPGRSVLALWFVRSIAAISDLREA